MLEEGRHLHLKGEKLRYVLSGRRVPGGEPVLAE